MTEETKSLQKYIDAFSSMTVPIATVDLEGHQTSANKAFCELLGYEESELVGQRIPFSYWPKEDLAHIERAYDNLVTKGNIGRPLEMVFAKKDDTRVPVSVVSSELKDDNGKLIGYSGFITDISERKRAEEMLRESEERCRTIFKQATDSIVLIDAKTGELVEFNDKACRNLGYTREEFKKLKIPDFEAIESAEEVKKHLNKIVKKGSDTFETKHKTKDGKIRNIIVSSRALSISGRDFVQSIWYDITERRRSERKLKSIYQKLMESNKKLRHLVVIDPHTGLYNYLYLRDILESEFNRAKRHLQPLSIILFDIDYFKSINDVYGHRFGDLVLKQFSKQLKKMVRKYDIVTRFGGEEFIIVSPETNRGDALHLAQRILDAMNLYNFGNKKHVVKLKLSAVVCSYPEDDIIRATGFIDLGDRILNTAKERGGNRVCSSLDLVRKKQIGEEKAEAAPDVKSLEEKINKLTKRANQSLIEAIFAFAKTIELKDHYTGEHAERTVRYALEIARALRLHDDDIERIRKAAILHDLGKIGISEKILNKQSKLTKKEFEKIKKHPQIAIDIIRPVQFLQDVIPLILHHHEHWDGKGYPSKIKGEEIPIGARIIALADAYQALTSNRPYRKAYSKKEAVEIIRKESGTKFDPQVVSAFLKILQKGND